MQVRLNHPTLPSMRMTHHSARKATIRSKQERFANAHMKTSLPLQNELMSRTKSEDNHTLETSSRHQHVLHDLKKRTSANRALRNHVSLLEQENKRLHMELQVITRRQSAHSDQEYYLLQQDNRRLTEVVCTYEQTQEKLRAEILNLQGIVADKNKEIESKIVINDKQKNTIKAVLTSKEKVQLQLNVQLSANDALKIVKDKLESKIQTQINTMSDQKRDNEYQQSKISALTHTLETTNDTLKEKLLYIEQLSAKNKLARQEIVRLHDRITILSKQCDHDRKKYSAAQLNEEKAIKNLNDLKDELLRLRRNDASINASLKRLRQEHHSELEICRDEYLNALKQTRALSEELKKFQDKEMNNKIEMNTLNAQVERYCSELQLIHYDVQVTKEQLDFTKKDLSSTKTDKAKQEVNLLNIKEQLENMKRSYNILKNDYSKLIEEHANIKVQLNQSQVKEHQLDEYIIQLEIEHETKLDQLQSSLVSIKQQQQVEKLEKELNVYKIKISQLEKQKQIEQEQQEQQEQQIQTLYLEAASMYDTKLICQGRIYGEHIPDHINPLLCKYCMISLDSLVNDVNDDVLNDVVVVNDYVVIEDECEGRMGHCHEYINNNYCSNCLHYNNNQPEKEKHNQCQGKIFGNHSYKNGLCTFCLISE